MSTNHKHSVVYSVDPAIIEAAMQRGRQERSKAFWAMLQAIFARPEARVEKDQAANCTGAAAHC